MSARNLAIRTTWPGRLAVLGLTAAVLPLDPLWAQKPGGAEPAPPGAETKVETRATKDKEADIVIGGDDEKAKKDEVRDSLEELKRSLRREGGRIETEVIRSLDRALKDVRKALEDAGLTGPEMSRALKRTQEDLRQALERRGSSETRPDAERGEAKRERDGRRRESKEERRDEAVERAVQLSRARAEVRALETRLHQARERLSQLQGLPRSRLEPFEFGPGRRGEEPKGAAPDAAGAFLLPNPRLERRLQDLEAKFDRLLKELQELKRERRPAPKPDDDSVL
jgi:hypothetical protein